jgi:hypothetical protein
LPFIVTSALSILAGKRILPQKSPSDPFPVELSPYAYIKVIIMKWGAAASVISLSFCGVVGAFTTAPRPRTTTRLFTMLDRRTGQSQLDPSVIDRYAALPFPPNKILAEYVWVDADGNTRSKTRTLAADKVR